jgi:hypothetical protein
MCWPSRSGLLSGKSSPSSKAFHVHLKDRCVMDETVHRSKRHRRILKDLSPFAERLICCNYVELESFLVV